MLRGRSREALHATVLLQLRHFLRHILLVLDQNVLVLDIQLAQFEIEHFHDLFQVVVAGFDHFLGL